MRPILLFLCLSSVGFAESGTLDSSFGIGGVSVTSLTSDNDFARGMTIQKDGKIIAVGEAWVGGRREAAVARYDSSGHLDPSFHGGSLILPVGPSSDIAWTASVQSDRKIVLIGWSRNAGSGSSVFVIRLNSDGTFDSSFGNQGTVLIARPGWWMVGYAATLQKDGKVVVAAQGVDLAANEYYFLAIRLNGDGSLDSSFGDSGIGQTPVKYGFPHAVRIRKNGDVLIGGHYYVVASNSYQMGIVQFHSSGSLDTAFGVGGLATLPVPVSIANRIVLTKGGRFYAAGGGKVGTENRFLLARFLSNGQLDSSFATGGIATLSIGGVDAQAFGAVAYGKGITLGGYANVGGENRFAFARFHRNGTVDTTFGQSGVTTVSAGPGVEAGGHSLSYDRKRKRVVAAGASSSGGFYDFTLVGVHR